MDLHKKYIFLIGLIIEIDPILDEQSEK